MVIDLDAARLLLAHRFDVATFQGNAASRRTLEDAGVRRAKLFIACTSRDETNLIAACSGPDGCLRRDHDLDRTRLKSRVHRGPGASVSSTSTSSSPPSSRPLTPSRGRSASAARQTDVFADGQVQVVEFDVEADHGRPDAIGPPLREAKIPRDSRVVGIIRGGELRLPTADETIQVGDRIIVIGSPRAARDWSRSSGRRTGGSARW